MPYCTVTDVLARTAYRGTYTTQTTPTASQVYSFIQDSAGQLDQWLYAGGYAAPFDAAIASGVVATTSLFLLRRWNVTGAALLVEEAAQSSEKRVDFIKLWDDIKAAIKDRENDLNLPTNPSKSNPRGPGAPGGLAAPSLGIGRSDIVARVGLQSPGSWDL